MYRNTRFSDILKGLSRGTFDRLVEKHQADKYCKGFRSWGHLVSMIFAQLSDCRSLRQVEAGFNSQAQHHYHLGTHTLKRSTLSEANQRRNSELFAELCGQLMQGAQRQLRRELGDLLYLLDSSPIHLAGLGYDDWAKPHRSNISQGIKLHLMIEAQGEAPCFTRLTDAKVSDIKIGRTLVPEKGATYVFDKGYYDYNWWYQMESCGAKFVTRFKRNAAVRCESIRPIDLSTPVEILEDAVVQFTRPQVTGSRGVAGPNQYYGTPVRRITVDRPDKGTPLILVTNDFDRSAADIAGLYKARWGIELFFKWIKQNLKIKRFLGRSKNAVKTQIYIALITYLLVQLHHLKSGATETLSLFLTTIKVGLFQRPEVDYELLKRRKRRQLEMSQRQAVLAI